MAPASLSEVMTRNVLTARRTESLESIRELMVRHKVSRIVIVNELSQPVGMVTSRDLLRHTLMENSKRANETTALQVMTKPVVTLPEEETAPSCAKRMLESAISSIVVVRGGVLAGIVTKTDLCKFYATSGIATEAVQRRMTAKPISARASQRVLDAARIMADNSISRIPVVNDHLEGIITLSDLTAVNPALNPVAIMAKEKILSLKGRVVVPIDVGRLTIAQVMTRNPITVPDAAPLSDAAKLMLTRGISGLPVLDSNGMLVGIVTKTDVTKAVAALR